MPTTSEIWNAIRQHCKEAWQFADAAGKDNLEIRLSAQWSGVQITGATGTLRIQLLSKAAEIRAILMDDCEATFPDNQGVSITVNAIIPAPAAPPPPQFPFPPPIFSPPMPPTTPPTDNDYIRVA